MNQFGIHTCCFGDAADGGFLVALIAESGVWRNLSVAENVEFCARVYGISGKQAQERSDKLLRQAGLLPARHRLAGKLSGGMRQKLGVVLATMHQPAMVILDEPTTRVDPISRAELWSMMSAAAAEGATVIFATTYLDEAERATQVCLLDEGKLLAAGPQQKSLLKCQDNSG